MCLDGRRVCKEGFKVMDIVGVGFKNSVVF